MEQAIDMRRLMRRGSVYPGLGPGGRLSMLFCLLRIHRCEVWTA